MNVVSFLGFVPIGREMGGKDSANGVKVVKCISVSSFKFWVCMYSMAWLVVLYCLLETCLESKSCKSSSHEKKSL